MNYEQYAAWCRSQAGLTKEPVAVASPKGGLAGMPTEYPSDSCDSGPPTLRSEPGRVVITPTPKRSV